MEIGKVEIEGAGGSRGELQGVLVGVGDRSIAVAGLKSTGEEGGRDRRTFGACRTC